MTTSNPEPYREAHGVNLALVLLVHVLLGWLWVFALSSIIDEVFDDPWGLVWGFSAAGLWVIGVIQIVHSRTDPARTWGLAFFWWLKSFVAPFALGFEALQRLNGKAPSAGSAKRTAADPLTAFPPVVVPPSSSPGIDLSARLDDFARRLAGLEHELRELRRLATEATVADVQRPVPPPVPSTPEPPAPPSATPPPSPARIADDAPPRRRFWDRDITFDDLFGAKALAWAGGFVTLLGIVFFFVLAVNRGWIGPIERVALGALASLLVFGAGVWLRRAYGPVHSALAAAGAGIAGGYATLLAATALYDLVPREVALVLAAAIAAVATVTALAWSSELVAGLGLIGATLAPAAIALQDGEWSAVGTGFAAVMFAATAIVAVRRRWQSLLTAGLVASLPQVSGLVSESGATDWDVVVVAGAFWALYLGAAIALHVRLGRRALASLPTTLVLLGGLLAGISSVKLFDGDEKGWVLLAVAVVEAAVAAALFVRQRERDLSALLGAVALALGAVAAALILSGPALTIAWAAEAAVLAWLARRADEMRYQVAALVYLVAATIHALFWEAPFEQLYTVSDDPASGVVALIAVAVAAAVFARYTRPWAVETFGGVFALVAPILEAFREHQRFWRAAAGWTSALTAVYAAALGVLEGAQWVGGDDLSVGEAFDWGHVGVAGLWGLAALGAVALGHLRSSLQVRLGGLVLLGGLFLNAILFDITLDGDARPLAFLVAAAALLAGALLDRLFRSEADAFPFIAGFVVASLGLGVAGVLELTSGDWEGYGLLALAALYCLVALACARDRDLSTVLWAPAFVVAGYAASTLLDGTWLVLAWSVAAAILVALANRTKERRLEVASVGFLACALVHTFAIEAPLADLFEKNPHPENGVPALLIVLAAAAAFGFFSRGTPPLSEESSEFASFGLAALLAIYAGSLAILGLAQLLGDASVATDFQRGHTGVSAFWGVIGLVALYVGLRRGARWLRLAGFGLFGLALAKLFLYDLAFLSSVTRALSFLAVGAVLLFGGFLIQKLGAERREEPV